MSLMRELKCELDAQWELFTSEKDLVDWMYRRFGDHRFVEKLRTSMMKDVYLEENSCRVCLTPSVLRAEKWDGTLGAIELHMCDHFMRTGELYYPNRQLPPKLNSHRGYHVLRHMNHAITRPSACPDELELESDKKATWLPTVAGLEFVLHETTTAPRFSFVHRAVVIGTSYVSQEARCIYALAGGQQRLPESDLITFREVLAGKGFDADVFWACDQSDKKALDVLANNESMTEKFTRPWSRLLWLSFWADHLNVTGGWERREFLAQQQQSRAGSVDAFTAALDESLAWRESHWDSWIGRAKAAKSIVFERAVDSGLKEITCVSTK